MNFLTTRRKGGGAQWGDGEKERRCYRTGWDRWMRQRAEDKERNSEPSEREGNKVRFALIGALRLTVQPGHQTRNSLHGSRLIEAVSIYQLPVDRDKLATELPPTEDLSSLRRQSSGYRVADYR